MIIQQPSPSTPLENSGILSEGRFCALQTSQNIFNALPAATTTDPTVSATMEALIPNKFRNADNSHYFCDAGGSNEPFMTKPMTTPVKAASATVTSSPTTIVPTVTRTIGKHTLVVLENTFCSLYHMFCCNLCAATRHTLICTLGKNTRAKQREAHCQAEGAGDTQFSQSYHRGSLSSP